MQSCPGSGPGISGSSAALQAKFQQAEAALLDVDRLCSRRVRQLRLPLQPLQRGWAVCLTRSYYEKAVDDRRPGRRGRAVRTRRAHPAREGALGPWPNRRGASRTPSTPWTWIRRYRGSEPAARIHLQDLGRTDEALALLKYYVVAHTRRTRVRRGDRQARGERNSRPRPLRRRERRAQGQLRLA